MLPAPFRSFGDNVRGYQPDALTLTLKRVSKSVMEAMWGRSGGADDSGPIDQDVQGAEVLGDAADRVRDAFLIGDIDVVLGDASLGDGGRNACHVNTCDLCAVFGKQRAGALPRSPRPPVTAAVLPATRLCALFMFSAPRNSGSPFAASSQSGRGAVSETTRLPMNGNRNFQWLRRRAPLSSPRQPRALETPRAAAIRTGTRATVFSSVRGTTTRSAATAVFSGPNPGMAAKPRCLISAR